MPRRVLVVPVVLTVFLSTPGAFSHDNWISRKQHSDPQSRALCCNEHDCFPLNDKDVQMAANGFVINGQYFVARQRILPSNDSQYWACFNSEGIGPHDRKKDIRCFFAPMNT